MARISNGLFIVLNFISFVLGFVAVAWSAYIQVHDGTVCQKALETPLLVMGLFLLTVSFLGLIGACCRANSVLIFYLFVMLLLILGLISFTIFAFVVTNNDNKDDSGNRVQGYSRWMQNRFVDEKHWKDIKSCLIDAHLCKNLDNLDIKNWSLMKSSCCKPPKNCNFKRVKATFWMAPETGAGVGDGECRRWSNKEDQLCYDCNSCKGGVLANIRKQWRILAEVNIGVIFIVILVFYLGCVVRKNNQLDRHIRYNRTQF